MWEAGEVNDLIGRVLGQQHTGQQTSEKKMMKPQTEEQRGKRACAFTARGSISKAKELVGGAAGRGRTQETVDQSSDDKNLRQRRAFHRVSASSGQRAAWRQASTKRHEEL